MDLRTTYVGLTLEHPIVASAGPPSETLDVRRLEDGGAAAVVLFSLFEEQIRHANATQSALMEAGSESCPEALSYFPALKEYAVGPDAYLELIRRAREAIDVPVFGSLNAVSSSGWADYARLMEVDQLKAWMASRRYTSVTQLKGPMSQRYVADPAAFERADYIRVLRSYRPPHGMAP